MIVKKLKCIKSYAEDGVQHFDVDEYYDCLDYGKGVFQVVDNDGYAIDVSDSGDFKFKDYFTLVI